MNPIKLLPDTARYTQLVNDSAIKAKVASSLPNMSIDQQDVFVKTLIESSSKSEIQDVFREIFTLFDKGDSKGAMKAMKKILPDGAAMEKTPLGVAIMDKDWDKPVIFPNNSGFKWLGWADDPSKITTDDLWQNAYGKTPDLIFGAVGNSNIKPEQVLGGCSMSKKELSKLYENSIVDFFRPIVKYLKELGAKTEDIGFGFAHSDCGVDKAAREIVEEHGLKGLATTPTMYTQYLRGTQMPATVDFPNGYVLADFPFPTVLTRNIEQIDDYAKTYNTIIGKKNPLGVFGGGEHAFKCDSKEAIFGRECATTVPVDIMKDMHGIVIPSVNADGVVTNAAANYLEKIDKSPYTQYKFAFNELLPFSPTKSDLAQYDPQMAMATIAYSKLAQAGKLPK